MAVTKYNKAIGTLVGAAIGAAVAFGIIPEAWATPEVQGAIITLVGILGTIFSPKNSEA